MKNKLTIEGQWQIFPDRQDGVVGTLNFDPERGLELVVRLAHDRGLMGVFEAITRGQQDCPRTITGIDANRQAITLFGCGSLGVRHTPALEFHTIHAISAVLGGHFRSLSDVTCAVATANYSLLDNWLLRPVAAAERSPDGKESVRLQSHPDITARLNDGVSVSIHQRCWQEPGTTAWKICQHHEVLFSFPQNVPFSDVFDNYLQPFRNFLTFLTGCKGFLDSITFNQLNRGSGFAPMEYLAACSGVSKANREEISPSMPVPYAEIAPRFPELIQSWFKYFQKMEAIISLYFASIWSSGIPSTTQFLLLAQALEAYHSRCGRFAWLVQPADEFRRRVEAVVDLVENPAEKLWLKDKLHFANQKTLAERLHDLAPSDDAELAAFISDPKEFQNKIRHTRNYYTHFDEELPRKGKVAEGAELANLTFRMRTLLQILMLRDLGLPNTAVARVVASMRSATIITLDN